MTQVSDQKQIIVKEEMTDHVLANIRYLYNLKDLCVGYSTQTLERNINLLQNKENSKTMN